MEIIELKKSTFYSAYDMDDNYDFNAIPNAFMH